MNKSLFGKVGGKDVYRYEISGDGVSVAVLDFGATVQAVTVDGTDVVLGFSSAEEYAKNRGYLGANIGRVSNRIENAAFTLAGKSYTLTRNEGKNQLHGGFNAFHLKFYEVREVKNGVSMTCRSADGEEGYPGNLTEEVTFTVTGRVFNISYRAVSDKDTLWAPTSHIYFNMNGEVGNATSNVLTVYADKYTPVNGELIPTGTAEPVAGTPYDFRRGMVIEDGVKKTGGYDINFVLNGGHAATLTGDVSGLKAEIYTDMPCVQIYSGKSNMGGIRGKRKDYFDKEGIAIEPQFAPNAINMSGFDKPVLKAGEEKSHFIRIEL